jgi:hypothetical protein
LVWDVICIDEYASDGVPAACLKVQCVARLIRPAWVPPPALIMATVLSAVMGNRIRERTAANPPAVCHFR